MVKSVSPEKLQDALREKARELGFVACGFTGVGEDPLRTERFEQWLGEGRHGAMEWMESRKEQRSFGGKYEHHLVPEGDSYRIRHKKVSLINCEAPQKSLTIYL